MSRKVKVYGSCSSLLFNFLLLSVALLLVTLEVCYRFALVTLIAFHLSLFPSH